MRIILGAAIAAATLAPTVATAQQTPWQAQREYNRDVREAQREYRRDIRNADDRRDVREARRDYRENVRDARRDYRQDTRDWRRYQRYDYNRYEPGQRAYFADRYYRDGRYYQPRTLGRNDRIYRGYNGRYYSRRNDGTTGLIVGGLAGGALGNIIAGGGALLGQSVDRGQVVCR